MALRHITTKGHVMSDFLTLLSEQIDILCRSGNEISGRVATSLAGTDNKAIAEMIANSEDEKVIKFRQTEEAVLAKLEAERSKVVEYLKGQMDTVVLSEGDIENLKVEWKGIKDNYAAALKYAAMQPGYSVEWAERLPKLNTFKGVASKTGKTGIKRPRFDGGTIDGSNFSVEKTAKDGTVERSFTLTALALELAKREKTAGNSEFKTTAAELLAAVEESAGGADWRTAVSIKFVVPGQSHNYLVEVFPKSE